MKKREVKYILPVRLRGDKKRIAIAAILEFQHIKNLIYIIKQLYNKHFNKYLDISTLNKLANGKLNLNIDDEKFTNVILQLRKLYKENGSDFFQAALKQVEQEYRSYFRLLEKYKNGEIEDKPNPPRPRKLKNIINGNIILVHRQFKQLKDKNGNLTNAFEIKISKKYKFNISFSKLQYIDINKIKTFGIRMSLTDLYLDIYYVEEIPKDIKLNKHYRIGIDLGVDNLATLVTNIKGLKAIIFSGKELKAFNQWANKEAAKLQSLIDVEKDENIKWELKLKRRKLLAYRKRRILSMFHQITNKILHLCLKYGISTIYIGELTHAKENSNLGKVNNQNFYYIPYSAFIHQLEYKCAKYGIKVEIVKEYYTSATSALTNKVYKRHEYRKFSRGLYYDEKINKIWNADCNGAFNILRFNYKNAFKNFSFKEKLDLLARPIKFKLYVITNISTENFLKSIAGSPNNGTGV